MVEQVVAMLNLPRARLRMMVEEALIPIGAGL